MFGFVTADLAGLSEEQQQRYHSVYCGICRQIRLRASGLSRLGLRYDMAFLALLLMSLYEPEEQSGRRACGLHPIKPRPWLDNEYIDYAADMNVALAYYNALDDWRDEKKPTAKAAVKLFGRHMDTIEKAYPRQCGAMAQCITALRELEQSGCANPDAPANCFAALMAELMVCREDIWSPQLRQVGYWLGRFIYLADAVLDYTRDQKKKQYNPLIACAKTPDQWEEYLVLAMGKCTQAYEILPLVQDKALLDNILYSGVWLKLRQKERTAPGGSQ